MLQVSNPITEHCLKFIILRKSTMERERMYRIVRTRLYRISVRKRRSILSRGQTDDVLEYLREMALIIKSGE